MSFQEKKKYLGHVSQLFDVRTYRLCGGRMDGVKATSVKMDTGLEFTVFADRCMDPYYLSYRGRNLSYIGPVGVVAPSYFLERDLDFLYGFTAGSLSTCGLSNIGSPSEDDGEILGLHGRLSHTPAEDYGVWVEEDGDGVPCVTMRGRMREAKQGLKNLIMTREIRAAYGGKTVTISDTFENAGFTASPFMLLYHCNFGYPLLSENAEILLPSAHVRPRTDFAAQALESWSTFEAPIDGIEERCYYHDLKTDAGGNTVVAVYNDDIQLGLAVHFNKKVLDHLIQWKNPASGCYALGLEPCNCEIDTRSKAKADGNIKYLQPGEKVHSTLVYEILDGKSDRDAVKAQQAALR